MKSKYKISALSCVFLITAVFLLGAAINLGISSRAPGITAYAGEPGPNSFSVGEQAHIDLGKGYNELPYFSYNGYTYNNYQNGYTVFNQSAPKEITTYFGRNAFPAEGGVEIKLIDLTTREHALLPGDLGTFAMPVDEKPETIKAAFIKKYKEVIQSGFSLGTPQAGIGNLSGMLIQDFKWTDSVFNYVSGTTRNGWAMLIYNPALKECFLVKDNMARTFPVDSKSWIIGTPVSDEFTVRLSTDKKEYVVQNFSRGYFRVDAGVNKSGSRIDYRNVTADGYEQILTHGDNDNTVGIVDEKYADGNFEDRNHVGTAVRDRYYQTVAQNLNPGFVRSYVRAIEGIWMQFYQNETNSFSIGSSSYEMHLIAFQATSYPNLTGIVYNPTLQKAYMVKDDFLTCYLHEDVRFLQDAEGNDTNQVNFEHADIRMATLVRSLGAPVGEMFIYSGARYQNFENGYIRRNGTTASSSGLTSTTNGAKDNTAVNVANSFRNLTSATSETIIWNKNITEQGEVSQSGYENMNFDGKVSIAAQTDKLDETKLTEFFDEKITALKESAADTEIKKASPIKGVWKVGIYSTLQELRETNAQGTSLSAISYNVKQNAVYYISPAVYSAYSDKVVLGAAISELEVVDGYFRQMFEHGYIQYKNGEAPVVKVGYVYNTVTKKFINENFAGRVGEITTISGKDPVKNAGFSGYTYEELTEKFKAAYNEFFAKGVNIGIPDEKGIFWWQTGRTGLICQQFIGGDGTGDFKGTSQMLCYDPQQQKVFLVTGNIYSEYCRYLPMIVGMPTQNIITASDGLQAQNFYGPMGDFHFRLGSNGQVEYFDFVFHIEEYEASKGV